MEEQAIQKSAPEVQCIMRETGGNDDVTISVIAPAHYAEVAALMREFLGPKSCLCVPCCSYGSCESVGETTKKFNSWPADRVSLGAVALDKHGAVIGHAQLATHGHKNPVHTVKAGEAYLEHIAVRASARGMGVGTKLLDWCEATARARGCTILTLGVLKGNPAIKLYKRKGFVAQSSDCVEDCIAVCLLGRPYGLCAPDWGGFMMEKRLS